MAGASPATIIFLRERASCIVVAGLAPAMLLNYANNT